MSLPTPVFLTTQSTSVTRAASHGCFGEGATYVAGNQPSPRLFSRGRAALLSRASCTSCLAAPPLATSAPAPACGFQHRLGPSGGEAQCVHPLSVRYLRVNRRPGVAEEGRGDGLRRCRGRGNILRRDGYEQRFYHLCRHDRVGDLAASVFLLGVDAGAARSLPRERCESASGAPPGTAHRVRRHRLWRVSE